MMSYHEKRVREMSTMIQNKSIVILLANADGAET